MNAKYISFIKLSAIFMTAALTVFSSTLYARDKCDTAGASITISVSPGLKCKQGYDELYKETVSDNVFKAQKIVADVDHEVKTIKAGLKEEDLQQTYYEYISNDSIVNDKITIRNKKANHHNYTVDPTAKAVQSLGAVR